jgi:hypothetical protein
MFTLLNTWRWKRRSAVEWGAGYDAVSGPAILNWLTVQGYSLMEISTSPGKLAAAKKYVYDRLQDGRSRPRIAKAFSFAQIVEA